MRSFRHCKRKYKVKAQHSVSQYSWRASVTRFTDCLMYRLFMRVEFSLWKMSVFCCCWFFSCCLCICKAPFNLCHISLAHKYVCVYSMKIQRVVFSSITFQCVSDFCIKCNAYRWGGITLASPNTCCLIKFYKICFYKTNRLFL